MARELMAKEHRTIRNMRVIQNTTNFIKVEYGDVLLLETGAYLIKGHEHEGRFGLDDEIKHWVKKAVDVETGQRKVIKLVFFERFTIKLANITYECYRSPQKEARILELVAGNPNFMQGVSCPDEENNNVRIIDFVYGTNLGDYVEEINHSHEHYFHELLPGLLDLFLPALAGLSYLHKNHEKHGDVRRDHIICSREGPLVWIDFDYNYRHGEHIAGLDMAGVGNILTYLVGGADHTVLKLKKEKPHLLAGLTAADFNVVMSNRVVNLQKLFPYIPDRLNNILLHFSGGTPVFYDTVDELLSELAEARATMT
jgi:hypothetical protein